MAATLLLGCPAPLDDAPGDDDVPGQVIEDCLAAAAELPTTQAGRLPIEDMDAMEAWQGYAYHLNHWHNEGIGKWYFFPTEHIEVRAPAEGYICWPISPGSQDTDSLMGYATLPSTRMALHLGGDRRVEYDHVWVLEELRDTYEEFGGVAVHEGDLLGFTPGGPGSPIYDGAMDFRFVDNTFSNGLPDRDNLIGMRNWHCPMDFFDGDLRDELDERWTNLTYTPAVEANNQALAAGTQGDTAAAELAEDSCSELNVDSDNEGSIWGNWYNEAGPLSNGDPLGIWFHYPRGTVTLLPNSALNPATYTVGWMQESGLFSEMLSAYWPQVSDPWAGSVNEAVSMILPAQINPTDPTGCFGLEWDQGAGFEWVAFELTAEPGGDDRLALSRSDADNLNDCLIEGVGQRAEELFSRYP